MAQASNKATKLAYTSNTSAQTCERRADSATRSIAAHIVEPISSITSSPHVLDNACDNAGYNQRGLEGLS